ncbi:MAG: hypothetical protein QOD60_298 [Solirubrobacterales bacterium]|nr:hypothetical protein [Solirubrobacterales bacterium]
MNAERHAGRRPVYVVLALIAALALVFAGLSGPPAGASGGNTASAAKKKCKKGFKLVHKHGKKKCKKKKPTTTTTAPPQVVRATLTWSAGGSSDVDLDLFAFDASGNRAGNGSDAIPNSTLSPDVTGPDGTETFKAPAGTVLSFGVCYKVGGSVHTPFTINYVTADSVPHTDSQNPGSTFHYEYPGGAPIPASYCP